MEVEMQSLVPTLSPNISLRVYEKWVFRHDYEVDHNSLSELQSLLRATI